MKKFTIPRSQTESPIEAYIGEPADGEHPLAQQAAWLLRERGEQMPQRVLEAFGTLVDVARQQEVDFEELAVRTLSRGRTDGASDESRHRAPGADFKFEPPPELIPMTEQEIQTVSEGGKVILYDHGQTTDGRPYWLYIDVLPDKYAEYIRRSQARETIHYQDYGTIIKYGFEENIPDSVRREMDAEYADWGKRFRKFNLQLRVQQIVDALKSERQAGRPGDVTEAGAEQDRSGS